MDGTEDKIMNDGKVKAMRPDHGRETEGSEMLDKTAGTITGKRELEIKEPAARNTNFISFARVAPQTLR